MMNKKMNKNNKGFTLVELIIVIAIIAILLALIAPNLTSFLDSADNTALKANAKTAYSSAFAWATSQKVAGTAMPSATKATIKVKSHAYGSGADATAAEYKALEGFFDPKGMADCTITIEFNGYQVVGVKWEEGTKTGLYPDGYTG